MRFSLLASTAAIWTYRDDPLVLAYCSDMEKSTLSVDVTCSMHKVVLEVKDDAELLDISATLKMNKIDHILWREQPENIVTALATKPCTKSIFGTLLRHLRLLKLGVC